MLANLPGGARVALAVLKAQKHSPNLLFGAGVVGVVSTVVLASRATLKLNDIVDEASKDLARIDELVHEDYSDKDKVKDRTIVYSRTALSVSKIYAPALIIGVISIGCLTGSHQILTRRNVALTAAYAGAERALREYRERVISELGPEKEQKIWQPTETVEGVNEDGKKTKIELPTKHGGSPYKQLFDEFNRNWNKDWDYNRIFLSSQQNYANDLLRSRGYVFLNEVHDMLGLERTKAGQIVGWVWNGNGDSYIDFGVFSGASPYSQAMKFVMGDERSIWLDFNVDGAVLDIVL